MLYETSKTPSINGRLFEIRWATQETSKTTFKMIENISHQFVVKDLRNRPLDQVVVENIYLSQGKIVQVPFGLQQVPTKECIHKA